MTNRLTLGSPLPESLGACVDLYAEIRDLRLAMDKEVEAVQKRESEIKEHLIANLTKGEDSGVAGAIFRGHVTQKPEPTIADWNLFCSYVAKTGRFDMMQKRVTKTAILDTWEAEGAVPGIDRVLIPSLSVTKIPGR